MSLFPSPFTILRSTKVLGPSGVWVVSNPESLTFYGSVQPLSGFELEHQEAGSQGIGKVWIRTTATLLPRAPDSDTSGDILVWQGAQWEVLQLLPFTHNVIPHHQYLAEWRPTP